MQDDVYKKLSNREFVEVGCLWKGGGGVGGLRGRREMLNAGTTKREMFS